MAGPDAVTSFDIRSYRPHDLEALYEICLKTGNAGEDASGTIDDELLGHYFAAPYAVLEPALTFIATAGGEPCGYILGTADSAGFEQQARQRWFPPLAQRYPLRPVGDLSREAGMIRLLHSGYRAPPFSREYPAHLHVNLLPVAQGRGMGTRLIDTFCSTLRAHYVSGLHLGVDRRNARALRFYPRLGFEVIDDGHPGAVFFGMKL